MGKEYLWITSTWKCKKVACNTSRATNTPPAPTPPEASGGLRPLRPEVSGFGMECWGLKVWGSSESWVRVRVTGGGSPRINLIQMDLKLTHCTACYIDDVCLFTDTFEEHLQALKALLVMLDNVGLRAHPVKCKFACATVEFLGHRVGKHVWPRGLSR